jgi:hypothetical protein
MSTPQNSEPNPRTPEAPMAFTSWELVRGLLIAGVSFDLAVPALALVVMWVSAPGQLWFTVYVLVVGMLAIVPSTLLTVVSLTPVVRAIGRRLRGETRRWPHLLSYAVLGAGASIAASLVVGLAIGVTSGTGQPLAAAGFTVPVGVALAPVAAGAAALGWHLTVRYALAEDRAHIATND